MCPPDPLHPDTPPASSEWGQQTGSAYAGCRLLPSEVCTRLPIDAAAVVGGHSGWRRDAYSRSCQVQTQASLPSVSASTHHDRAYCDHDAPGRPGGVDALLCDLVRDDYVDVEAVALGAGLVHLLKPEGWADPGRILDGHRGTVVAGRQVVRVAEHGPPVRVPAGLG